MLGKRIFEFNQNDLIKGASSSEYISDGGFGPTTTQINLLNTPGVAYAPVSPTSASANVVGKIIASCEDPLVAGVARVFVDDEGNYYTWNGSAMTLARTDAGHIYVQGKTDMAAYQTAVFATSASHVVAWTVDSTFNATYYAFTGATGSSDALVPHPCLTYEDNIYYGNHQLLLRQTSVVGAPAVVLTLPADRVIVSLAIDPGSGNMLISTTGNLNLSDTRSCLAKVYYYDGKSNKTSKVVQVEQMITAFPTSAGGLYAAYGNNLGYWNGNGVTFLRNFSAISAVFSELFYKQHFANVGSTLYLIVKDRIFAHGPVHQSGEHVFYPAFDNFTDADLTHIANIGNGSLGIAYAIGKFDTWSVTAITTGNALTLYINEASFDRPYWIRRVKLWFKTALPDTGSSNAGFLQFFADGAFVTPNPGNNGVIVNTTGADKYTAEIKNLGFKADLLSILVRMSASYNLGVRRLVVYGDPADMP